MTQPDKDVRDTAGMQFAQLRAAIPEVLVLVTGSRAPSTRKAYAITFARLLEGQEMERLGAESTNGNGITVALLQSLPWANMGQAPMATMASVATLAM
jgi:hypothetical protein